MKVSIPKTLVDREYNPLPPGTYAGVIMDGQLRTDDERGRARLRISVDSLRAIGDTPDTNRKSFTFEIPVKWDGMTVTELESFGEDNGDIPFPLRLGAGLLAGLGEAVGLAERDEEGNVELDLDSVYQVVVDGTARGHEIAFSMTHRKYTVKGETDDFGQPINRTSEDVRRIGPASV